MLKTRAGEIVGTVLPTRHPPRILKRNAVSEKTGLKRSALYQRMALGTFPKQVRLGPHSVGWIESEVDSWIEDRVAERDAWLDANGKGKR
jgi:prophage regulatory protein